MQPWEEKIIATHRMRLRLTRYVNELNGQLPDPDIVIQSTLPVKEMYSKMHQLSKEVIEKAQNKDNAITAMNCELMEDTILTYMNIALAYAQRIKQLENKKGLATESGPRTDIGSKSGPKINSFGDPDKGFLLERKG